MALRDFAQRVADTLWGSAPHASGGEAGQPASIVSAFDPLVAKSIIDSMTPGDLYATQPHLRTVVGFVARNGAQLGRHVYSKSSSGDRERVAGSVAARLFQKPNDYMSGFDLFNMLFSELALYDFALWVPVLRDGRWQIDPIPGEWITGSKSEDAFRRAGYWIKYPENRQPVFLPASDAIVFRGYSPKGFTGGSSPVRALRSTLAEQVAAMDFREQMWKRGGRVGMFMSRPATAPEWSPEAKQKFIQNWRANWSGNGANAGATPLLEDGMELKRVGFTAKEEQWLEAATLSLTTVAAAYHVPPAMVGVQGAVSFASVKEFRKMLYTETMGPSIAQVEDTINAFLFPFIGEPASHYLELNIAEKLQGDFEEQADQLFAAVGGPYMTPNEARRKVNLNDIEGGDTLLAPLNMGAAGNNGPVADAPIAPEATESDEAGKATPGSNRKAHEARADGGKASKPGVPVSEALEEDLKSYFDQVRRVTLNQLGAAGKADDPEWWNQKKWTRELSSLLFPHLLRESAGVARRAAAGADLDPDLYSVAQTENFLKAVADSRADLVNATIRDHYIEALENESDLKAVYADTESHAKTMSTTLMTFVAAFAAVEAAKQLAADKGPTKTWVSSGKPNSRHAAMNGETVPIDEPFSNGAMWPGDPVLGAKGVSNCLCGVDVNYD